MTKKQLFNILATVFALVINYLANALPINGIDTGEISDNIPSLFTPAGYVFSIWGIIYLGLIFFTVYQALPAQKNNPRFEKIGYWYVLSGILNGVWIFLWHYGQMVFSVLVMLGILLSLIMVYTRGGIGKTKPKGIERWAFDVPFGIYLGWISVATIANIAALGVVTGWGGWGLSPQTWTIIVMLVAMLLSIAMIVRRKEIAYPLVIVWAFIGINVAHMDVPIIAWVAQISAGFILGFLVLFFIITSRKRSAI
ncbi:MAG: tryptophan-rich sensory protein [Anaerolineaceae bacterium]|nr:tryptophan-rich sensory protein [Anaerolineaceae bacterium]